MEGRLRGLYAITDEALIAPARLPETIAAAIAGGARIVQYRDKSADHEKRSAAAKALAAQCRRLGALFIVNDDVELAAHVRADGVHLGKDDAAYEHARATLGPAAIIGISCYDDFSRAQHAARMGANYVAFGRFFASQTKPGAVSANIELLRAARDLHIPVAAIGGITPDNGAALVAAGAHMLAAVHGVFAQSDVKAAAQRYAELFIDRASAA